MELGVLAGRDPLALDARLHPPDGGHVALGEGPVPDELVDERHEPLAQGPVAGHDAGPSKRLALPGLGPAVEVRRVPVQVAGQASLAAFGPEPEVDRRHPLRPGSGRA